MVFTRPQPASILIDADSGKILESENPDAPRYPASLTKMMTLYLTFEALAKHRLTLDTMLPVSAHASAQPQTNIALMPGDQISVKDAVLSIVVRSANDSAVTLGEALGGGSEDAFAQKMTQKAHAIGMKHTIFQNASGLPDPTQHTTARDMAVLGLALRKNFPQYYPFFKTESFSFRDLTYVTHNHVMTRYDGVDGIKTGYIRASGFNLVTSANRGGHHIIGVVLGGPTWRMRDDKMIALLDNAFTQLAALPGNRVQLAASVENRRVAAFPAKPGDDEAMEGEGDRSAAPLRQNEPLPAQLIPAVSAESPAQAERTPAVMLNTPQAQLLWGIQIGAFARSKEASAAISRVLSQAPEELKGAQVTITDTTNANAIHRARLLNLSEENAESACHKLTVLHEPCFVYRMN